MTEDQYQNALSCNFKVAFDPVSKKGYSQDFDSKLFELFDKAKIQEAQAVHNETDDKNTHLFKLAARERIEEYDHYVQSKGGAGKALEEVEHIVALSDKYQVLSDYTAFIGEIK